MTSAPSEVEAYANEVLPSGERARQDPREAWVLRHVGAVLVATVLAVAIILVVGLFVAPGWSFLVDDHLVGPAKATAQARVRTLTLSVATVMGAVVAGALAWGRLDLSRQENRRGESLLATDRYTRAIEQLGSSEHAVRLGALYALEALAHDSPADRVTIAEVICAYARHHTVEETGSTTSDAGTNNVPTDGMAVDYKAAITIALRLPARWKLPIRDLRNTVVVDLDVAGCQLGAVDFRSAIFRGKTWFYGATFHGPALFNEATFEGGADFALTTFRERADFSFAEFSQVQIRDNYQRFRAGSPWFIPSDEQHRAHHRHHEGDEGVRFNRAVFKNEAVFVETRFTCWGTHFEYVSFDDRLIIEPRELEYCTFRHAQFQSTAEFYFPHGFDKTHFGNAVFERGASFNQASQPDGFEPRRGSDGVQRWFRVEDTRHEEP